MAFEAGQNVWVVGEETEAQYKGLLGKVVSVGRGGAFRYFVALSNGEQNAFCEDELAPAEVRVVDGVAGLTIDGRPLLGDDYLSETWRDLAGKHVTVTIVVKGE